MSTNPNAIPVTDSTEKHGTDRRTVIGIITSADHAGMDMEHPLHIDPDHDGVVV